MLNFFREEDYEKSLIELFQNDLEYEYVYGPDIERDFYNPFYEDVLIESLYCINLIIEFIVPWPRITYPLPRA